MDERIQEGLKKEGEREEIVEGRKNCRRKERGAEEKWGEGVKCKDRGGASICEHNRVRHKCKDCGGAGICEHNRVRYTCKDCGGAGI
jgi:hypothetical protein